MGEAFQVKDPNADVHERLVRLEAELELVQSRNRRVESDKAWEVSAVRVGFITLATYCATALVFYMIGVNDFLLNALIPTLGYYLSTQSLHYLRRVWQARVLKTRND